MPAELIKYLNSIVPLSTEQCEELVSIFSIKKYKKKGLIIRAGQICNNVYFIKKGCVKNYYSKQNKQVVNWFAFENNFVSSFYNFLSSTPSYTNLECLEDTEVVIVPIPQFKELADKYFNLLKLYTVLLEQFYILSSKRIISLQFSSAIERYNALLVNEPEVFKRIPLGDIASYLCITQVSLSRIRAIR